MNSKIQKALAGAACVMGFAIAPAVPVGAVPEGPPAATGAVAGPAPSPAYVWMSGHWNMESGQWKWVSAHWELPPSRSAIWVGGHWVSQGGSWIWVNGAWNVADMPQAEAGPPQPPGQPATQGQVVPAPSTPAPYLDGQYGPGGVDRAIDQPPVTTDYGPSYDVAYPGYSWTYDPWYWGGYPWTYLGWGPGFYGWWGGGAYGHWGHSGPSGRGGHAGHYGRGGGNVGRGAGGFTAHGSGGTFGGGHTH